MLIRYKLSFGAFFETLSEISFKGAGIEASLRRKQAEATAALVAATVARSEAGATPETTAKDVNAAATTLRRLLPECFVAQVRPECYG